MNPITWTFGKLAASRLGFALIKAYAFRTPHHHLIDLDGSLYMGRWRVVDEGTLGGRILAKLTGYHSVRLHHINRPDHDRDLHNHPFRYRTFILSGHYSEEYDEAPAIKWMGGPVKTDADFAQVAGHRFVHRGQSATGNEYKWHRIDTISVGGVWTLFFMTENTERWGFRVNGKFVDSVRYFLRRGYDRDAIRAVNK